MNECEDFAASLASNVSPLPGSEWKHARATTVRVAKPVQLGEVNMKTFGKFSMALSLVSMTATSFSAPAFAHTSTRYHTHRYHGKTHYAHRYCRRSSGATGLVAGGVGGAVIGSKVIGGGLLGVAAGAVGGAVAGRAIDRSMTAHRRCYWR